MLVGSLEYSLASQRCPWLPRVKMSKMNKIKGQEKSCFDWEEVSLCRLGCLRTYYIGRLASNTQWSSCCSFWNAGIIGMSHDTWFKLAWLRAFYVRCYYIYIIHIYVFVIVALVGWTIHFGFWDSMCSQAGLQCPSLSLSASCIIVCNHALQY